YAIVEDRVLSLIEPVQHAEGVAPEDGATPWAHAMVKADAARRGGFTGKGVGVAVLDTGVDGGHEALAGKIVQQVVWDEASQSWVAESPAKDTQKHGTHVAGLIAGKAVGVAEGAQIHSAVMLPCGNGHVSDFTLALEWAAGTAAIAIVNMSA